MSRRATLADLIGSPGGVILSALLLTVLALGGLVALATQSRQAQLDLAEENAVNLASRVAEETSNALIVSDLVARDVIWSAWSDERQTMRFDMEQAVETVPDIRAVLALDGTGRSVEHSSGYDGDLSEALIENIVRAHRDLWEDPVVRLLPGARGRGGALLLSRGAWDEEGTFRGLVVTLSDLTRMAETILLDPKSTYSKVSVGIGQQIMEMHGGQALETPFETWLDDKTLTRLGQGGRGELAEGARVMDRVVLGQILARDFPVRVFAQTPITDALSDWNGEVRVLFFIGATLGLAVFGFLVLYMRQETARSRAEEKLARGETRLKMALRNGMYGLFDWRLSTDHVHYSDENMLMLGEKPGSWSPHFSVWVDRIHPDDREGVLGKLDDHLKGHTDSYEARYRVRAADGGWRWIHAKGAVVERDDLGRPLRVVGTHGDVTDEVVARTEIEDKSRLLEESNRDLEQFAYVASHDLREPLRMVSSYLGLIRRRHGEMIAGEVAEFMGYAEDGAKRMALLVGDLLEYSRVSTQGLPMESMSLKAALDGALEALALPLRESGAEVVRPEADIPVSGDAIQISRLLQNLLGNSLKYHGPDQTPRIEIAWAEKGGWVHVVLSDNGIGFEQDQAERIFMIFQRLHGRDQFDGTGIGLAICRRIVERHGGRIEASGRPGKGARFHFTLPVAEESKGLRSETSQAAQ